MQEQRIGGNLKSRTEGWQSCRQTGRQADTQAERRADRQAGRWGTAQNSRSGIVSSMLRTVRSIYFMGVKGTSKNPGRTLTVAICYYMPAPGTLMEKGESYSPGSEGHSEFVSSGS